MVTHRDYAFERLADFLSRNDMKDKKVLEIGATIDYSARDLFLKFGVEDYKCVDKKEDIDVHNLPFEEETYDMIFSCHAFEHFENPVQALREIHRVLKPGGVIYLITPYPCEHQICHADDDHIFVLTPHQMARLLTYTKFTLYTFIVQQQYSGGMILKEQDYNVITIGRKE